MKLKLKKIYKKFHGQKSHNNSENHYNQYPFSNNPEVTQIVIDNEFDNKIKHLNKELDIANDDIEQLRQLGTQWKTNVSTVKAQDINNNIERLNIAISSRLRDVVTQLLVMGNETKNNPKDNNAKIQVSLQRKLADDLKKTMEQFSKVKSENQIEAYTMFKHQYMIVHGNASEEEIQKSFEDNNGAPIFIQKLSGSQQAKMAHQESQNINSEMKRIDQSIEELLYTFQEMQNILNTQNDVLVSVEENIDQVDYTVQQGSSEMVKAVKHRKSGRKILQIVTSTIVVILIIIGTTIIIIV